MPALPSTDDDSLPPLAERLTRLPPYGFAIISKQVGALTAAGHDVIRLDVGSPDMPPPDHVLEALRLSSANPAHHGYGSYQGHPSFRRAVADYYRTALRRGA